MTEPQVWVLMGVFATAIFGMMSWQTVSFNRNLTTSIDSVREVMGYRFEAMDAKLDSAHTEIRAEIAGLSSRVDALNIRVDGLNSRVDALNTRVDTLSAKVDALDQDVQALTRHVIRDDPHKG